MGCKLLNSSNHLILSKLLTNRTNSKLRIRSITFCSTSSLHSQNPRTQIPKFDFFTVDFKTLGACKLGISRYPDFDYDAGGGTGTGSAQETPSHGNSEDGEVSVSFDVDSLYIPSLTTETTKFLGLPLPPFLKIDIVPELFHGFINRDSGKVDLEFKAKFLFSVGRIYRAPPLLVKTVLTSEGAEGSMRRGRGERMDRDGKCRLVGVATVEPIDDLLLDSFLSLPTECIANLNAIISFS